MTDSSSRSAGKLHAPYPQVGTVEASHHGGGWLASALAASLVLVALAAAVAAMQFGSITRPVAAGTQALTGLHLPQATAQPALQGETASSAAPTIHWDGHELTMDLRALPLPQAVASLAQATGSTVTGAESLELTPVTLQFRGPDLNTAWRQLLRSQTAVALSCTSSACRVWIGGEATPQSPAAASLKARGYAPSDTGPVDMAPGEIESQPGGSC